MICSHCKRKVLGTRNDRLRNGLCVTCAEYKRRTGRDRPEHLFKPLVLCANCHADLTVNRRVGKLCVTCAEYKRRTGKNRSYRLWNKELLCRNKNCRIPLKLVRRKRGLYCANCDWYRKKYGVDRPASLCNHPEFGWCDCGKEAKHKKSFDILAGSNRSGSRVIKETLFLCDECFLLFV